MIYIYAPTTNEGGGKAIIELMVGFLGSKNITLICNKFLATHEFKNIKIKTIQKNFTSRLLMELWLRNNVKQSDILLCMSNLPPFFKIKGKVYVYLQNMFILKRSLSFMTIFHYVKYTILSLVFKFYINNINTIIVQNDYVSNCFISVFGKKINIIILPVFLNHKFNKSCKISKIYDFIYPASGLLHKNHVRLIEAWVKLAKKNIHPSLCLTLDKKNDHKLLKLIERAKKNYGVKIYNTGFTSRNEILNLYKQSKSLIFPSLIESCGLPLIEANIFGLNIIASDLPYVTLSTKPNESFDPRSTTSIVDSVLRSFKGKSKENKNTHVCNTDLKKIFNLYRKTFLM
jgi:hypothetical protein